MIWKADMFTLNDTDAPMDYIFTAGDSPVLLSLPHVGTDVPRAIEDDFTREGKEIPDTSWYLDRVFDFASELGIGVLKAHYSRYVTDLGRDPKGGILYEGLENTSICPLQRFDYKQIYITAAEPTEEEIMTRITRYWQPYHAKLAMALMEIKKKHGFAILIDATSIRSQCPRFFEGVLPDVNIGTNDGRSTDPSLTDVILRSFNNDEDGYSHILDGRFKGGYITRHFGDPRHDIHAVQIELTQSTYMDEKPPFTFQPKKADFTRPMLKHIMKAVLSWKPEEIRAAAN